MGYISDPCLNKELRSHINGFQNYLQTVCIWQDHGLNIGGVSSKYNKGITWCSGKDINKQRRENILIMNEPM